jgi:OOP family OmpA-OmpF porin
MTMKRRLIPAALLLSCSVVAHAETPIDLRPQISGMFSYVFEDSARGPEEGMGAYLAGGWNLGPVLGLEVGAFWHDFDDGIDRNGVPREWREWGGNLDALFHFNRNPRFTPYAVIGAGAMRLEDKIGDTRTTEPLAHVGLGFKSMLGERFGIRGDARYRYVDVSSDHGVDRSSFREPVVRLGFFVPLGAAPQPEPPPPPPPPPARPAPPPPPPPAPAPEPEVIYEIDQSVAFDFDSARIRSGAEPSLMEAARKINEDTTLRRVEVGGHTCDMGNADYNKRLSERRAQAVRDFLVNRGGVDASKLTVRGYGMDKPKVANDSMENRQRNRRVEISVLERSN